MLSLPKRKSSWIKFFNNDYSRFKSVSPDKKEKNEDDYAPGFKNLVSNPQINFRRNKPK